MNILVTGGSGFIGSHLIKHLLKKERHKIVSLDNYSTGSENNNHSDCTYYEIDITKTTNYDFFMKKPDVIFHLAALPRIQPSFKNPHRVIEVNVQGTLNMLEYARKTNSKLIYAGSSSSGGDKYANPYTFSKSIGEQYCRLYNTLYHLHISNVRFFNVYGPGQIEQGDQSTVIGVFKYLRERGEPLTITGSGEQRRDYTHVDDICRGLIQISENFFPQSFYELGTGVNYSILEIAEMFGGERKFIKYRKGEMLDTLSNSRKFPDTWKSEITLPEYIKGLDFTPKI